MEGKKHKVYAVIGYSKTPNADIEVIAITRDFMSALKAGEEWLLKNAGGHYGVEEAELEKLPNN